MNSTGNRNFMRKAGFLLILFLLSQKAVSQYRPIYYDELKGDVLYDISKDKSIKSHDGFYFPEYEFFEDSKLQGITLMANHPPVFKDSVWQSKINSSSKLKYDTTFFFMRHMVENVSSFKVCIFQDGIYWYKEFSVTEQGYQIPLNEKVTGWKRFEANPLPAAKILSADKEKLVISIQYKPRDREASGLVISELSVADRISIKKTVRNIFFKNIPAQDSFVGRPEQPVYYSDVIASGSKEETDQAQRSNVFIDDISDTTSEINIIKKVVSTALEKYPFYNERKLNPHKIQERYRSLIGNPEYQQSCILIQQMKNFLAEEFKDPHLVLMGNMKACEGSAGVRKVKRRPVRLYQINGKLVVATISDQRYAAELPIGAEILSIDGMNAEYLLDSLYPIKADRMVAKEFLHIISKNSGDSTRFEIRSELGIKTVNVKYDGTYTSNVGVAKNYDFKIINKNISYFKISRWSLDIYMGFLNHIDKINGSKRLVIDLRGNGGGAALSVFRLISLMINHNSELFETVSEDGIIDKTVIKPNLLRRLRKTLPVYLLSDKNTACASEMFIQSLKYNRGNVKMISTENTAGVLASRFDIHFPSGVIFSNNCFTGKMIFPGTGCLENVGIKPDIKVSVQSVFDLKPYNDLVLTTALK